MIERRTWDGVGWGPGFGRLAWIDSVGTQPAGVSLNHHRPHQLPEQHAAAQPRSQRTPPGRPNHHTTTQHSRHLPPLSILPHPKTEVPKHHQARNMRAFFLVALLACLALASAFVPRAALPKKAAVAVRSKLAPFQRCVGVSRACMYVFVCRSSS